MKHVLSIMNYESWIKTIIHTSLFIILFLLFMIQPVYAQTATSAATTIYPLPASVSPTSPLYTDLLIHNLFHSFSCLSIGQSVIGQPCLTYQLTKNAQGMIQGVPVLSQVDTTGGVLGTTTSLIGMLFTNPPVRTADYLASVGKGLGIVKEAKAQVVGSGAAVLNPILGLWTVSRNISYIIMIIIFVIIGLMVMFRTKINPQTVITAQAALPGLVLGLILITFSYFFAGLISDMAFVGTNIVGYYFSIAQHPNDSPQNLVDDIRSRNILSIFTPFTKTVNRGEVDSALSSIWDDLKDKDRDPGDPLGLDPQKVLQILTGFMTIQLLSPLAGLAGGWSQIIVGIVAASGAAFAPIQLASFAISFIAMAVLIYAMFKLLLRLISTFLTIIFLTITAPFQFLIAALPGRQGIATGWILNMLGNILIFPTVLAVLYFVAYLLGPNNSINGNCTKPCTFIISQSNPTPNNIMPPVYALDSSVQQTNRIVGSEGFPLFGGLSLGFIQLLLAFGALVALPKIPDIVVSTVGKAGQAGQLLGQEIGGSVGQGQRYAGQFQQGVGGLAGQAGRVTDEPGYILTPTGFRKPVGPDEMRFSGARPGQGTKIWEGIKNFSGRGAGSKPPKTT